MKQGKSLQELALELERQVKSKKDFIADSRSLKFGFSKDDNHRYGIQINGHGVFQANDLCHEQIANRLSIPQKYYDRLRADAPNLLATNINHWFQNDPQKRMVRTLDGKARALLSDRYRPLDNIDLAEAVLPRLSKLKCQVVSSEVTEKRLYIKAVTDRISGEVKKGDVVQSGLVVSNSEVGCGSLRIEPLIYRLVCSNGMIAEDYALRKYHVGRGHGDIEDATEFFKTETRQADDRAFWMKVQDLVSATLSDDGFQRILKRYKDAANEKIEGDPIKSTEVLATKIGLSEIESRGVLKHLLAGGDLSRYGMMNAVTRQAQDVESYDRATELERLGGSVLVLPSKDWSAIASLN